MMLRQSQTAVLERNNTFSENFVTEPFEAAWAIEGRYYVRVLDRKGNSKVTFTPQISPDGLNWVDLEASDATMDGEDLISWPVREFGHWTRLRADFHGGDSQLKLIIYLALKG